MSQDKHRDLPENEYQYSETDATPELAPEIEPMPKKSGLSGRWIKRIAILVALLIGVLVIYKFQEPKTSFTADEKSIIAPVAKTAVTTTTQTKTIQGPGLPKQLVEADVLLNQQSDALNQQENLNAEQLQRLQTTIDRMTASISDLQKSYIDLNQAVNTLGQAKQPAVQTVTQKLPKMAIKHKKAVVHYQRYTLKALVPQRAWLRADNGHSTTVKVGDRLLGYGRITDINVEQGWVGTSSGKIIKYGHYDS